MTNIANSLLAWLAARSIARGLPAPVADRGGYRVDSGLELEITRWVFPEICDGLLELGREIDAPHYPLKLCGDGQALSECLPSRWRLEPPTWFMIGGQPLKTPSIPENYRVEAARDREVSFVSLYVKEGPNAGELAASGYAAETNDAFVYDRIITHADHQRQGLGRAVMALLQAQNSNDALPELLVATQDGRALYESLGWTILSPYSTAIIPAQQGPPRA